MPNFFTTKRDVSLMNSNINILNKQFHFIKYAYIFYSINGYFYSFTNTLYLHIFYYNLYHQVLTFHIKHSYKYCLPIIFKISKSQDVGYLLPEYAQCLLLVDPFKCSLASIRFSTYYCLIQTQA